MAARPGGTTSKRPQRKSTAPRSAAEPALSLDLIVAAAVELLDADGVDGFTMRRLADRLHSGAMSLYWYVGSKEKVLDLALDAVLAYHGPPPALAAGDWRGAVVHLLEDWRASMLRHPWSASLLPSRSLGPSMLGRLESLSNALSGAGVADEALNVAIWSLWNFVMGATVTRGSFDLSDDDQAVAQQRLATLSDRYPTIERSRLLLDSDWDGAFRRGLDLLLDGVAPRR